MRTRSEWFLGARGSSLELSSHQFTLSTVSPQINSSNPLAGNVSTAANIGSYNFYTDDIDSRISSHHVDNVIVNVSNHNRNALSASALMLNSHLHQTLHDSTTHHHHHHHHNNSENNDDQSTLFANSISNYASDIVGSRSSIPISGQQSSLSVVVFTVLDFLF